MLNKIKNTKPFLAPRLGNNKLLTFCFPRATSPRKKLRGFTLIELLVVIAIIGLLSTLAIVALDSAREKARDARRVTDIRQIQTALELFFNDAEGYAGGDSIILGSGINCSGVACDVLCWVTGGGTSNGFNDDIADCPSGTVYMGQVPANPLPNGDNYIYSGVAGGVGGCSEECETYTLRFTLEGRVEELSAGPHVATPAGISN